jgi:hypothetical protein
MTRKPYVKLVLLCLVILALVMTAPTAAADGPQRVKLVVPPGTISGVCTFDVDVTIVRNTEYNIVFSDSAGNPVKIITQGQLIVTFTNVSNGNSLTLNISGPGSTTINPDGSLTIVFLGNAVLFSATDVIYSTGRVVVVAPSPLSPGTIVSASGIQRSLCALLA